MPKITATAASGTVSFDVPAGRKLVLALEDNGIDILHRCGGNAKCTTCRVELVEGEAGPMTTAETASFDGTLFFLKNLPPFGITLV